MRNPKTLISSGVAAFGYEKPGNKRFSYQSRDGEIRLISVIRG